MITWYLATEFDLDLLAEWNHQLIRDEGHRNPMTVIELRQRMAGWLALDRGTQGESFQENGSTGALPISAEYTAVIFSRQGQPVAYAVYRETRDEIYLRQFFVRRDLRRQESISDPAQGNLVELKTPDRRSPDSKYGRDSVLAFAWLSGLLLDVGDLTCGIVLANRQKIMLYR